ncbi:shikimate kinase [Demequina activiva]|uniref:Shikimate kinase n=1 Tax=Demequina activiva TaxID=1582364 RepID=A0A919Q2E5_9MICO|nr:shikimate kinase [Demequina activiva]GIG54616.1 shikimate kinase [Demequina activiva]
MAQPRLVLIGPPGSGKSSVGRRLAELTGLGWRDTDADVATLSGRSISDIFLDEGEQAFRTLERAAVVAALSEHDGVLSLGGGAVLDPATRDELRSYVDAGGCMVFLDVSLSAAAPRVGFNRSRPLLVGNPRQQWKALMDHRRPLYEELATVTVLTDALSVDEVATSILELEAHQ